MLFILTPGSLKKFDNLRKNYESLKHVDLRSKPSFISTPIFFGGTDIINRNKQISFLEKIRTILKIHLINEEDIKTIPERQTYIIAARFMIAACLYVQSQISSSKKNSLLYRIIEENLGITTENFLDIEDIETCYLTADRLIKTPNALEQSNVVLEKEGLAPFTEKEWSQFSLFLKEVSHKKEALTSTDYHNHFPITSLTKPLFGAAFSYVGATIGVVLAEGVSNSTSAISPRLHLTAIVGSSLLILTPSGTTGVALFAPVIAAKLLSSFCTISLAHVMGTAAGFLGQGVGIGVGLPFDLAYNLLSSICSIINQYYHTTHQLPRVDGIRITDGATIIAGIPIQLIPENALPLNYTKKILEITEQGEIKLDGEEIICIEPSKKITINAFDELKQSLLVAEHLEEKRDSDATQEDLDRFSLI